MGSYVEIEPDGPRYCEIAPGIKSSCPPQSYKGGADAFYRNNRDGTFTNVAKAVNSLQPEGKNLAVAAANYDDDGWPDLFVANDGIAAYLYHNKRGTFTEIGLLAEMAYDIQGKAMAAICVSLADYDNDGWVDLYISDFQGVGGHISGITTGAATCSRSLEALVSRFPHSMS